jgi:hypothetical protein
MFFEKQFVTLCIIKSYFASKIARINRTIRIIELGVLRN